VTTPEPEPRRVEPTGNPRVDALIDALVCPSCRTIYNAAKARCADRWHRDNQPAGPRAGAVPAEEPAVDWGEWTPGKGMERIRKEMPGMVPDITEEDERAVDEMLDPAAKRCPCCGKTRLMHPVFTVCKPCAAGLGWDPRCEACIVDDRGQDATGMEHVPTCDVSVRLARGATAESVHVVQPNQPSYRAVAGEKPCGDPACVCVAPQPPTTMAPTPYECGIFDAGVAEGLRLATEGARQLTHCWWWPDLADARQDFERLVGRWEPAPTINAELTVGAEQDEDGRG
jgi:hypothetical protein